MRNAIWAAALGALTILPNPAQAQNRGDRPGKVFRNEMKIDRLMDSLREEMWAYRQELEPFRNSPDYQELIETRYRLRNQAIRVAELEKGGGRAQQAQAVLAREMQREANELKRRTARLENKTDRNPSPDARRLGDRLRERADDIEAHIDRLAHLVR